MINVFETKKEIYHKRYVSIDLYCFDHSNKCIKFGSYKRGHTIQTHDVEERELSYLLNKLKSE